MAKEKVNKSQLIRDMLATDSDLSVRSIVNAMNSQGYKVQPSQVYALKAKMRAKKRRAVRQKVAATVNGVDPLVIIRQVKGLAEHVGGMARLKEIVEAMGGSLTGYCHVCKQVTGITSEGRCQRCGTKIK